MSKKTRLIILFICVVCFFIAAPVLVAYSMGYRFDFERLKVVATGGIYVRTFPAAGQITIDSDISEKPGMFANYIFVQSLLPKNHTVLVKKSGYYDYSKTLPVQENQVTKIENILLIKKLITFSDLANKVDYFSAAPNNQNIITASSNGKIISFSYFAANSLPQAKTFSVTTTGKVLGITWSSDSARALIEITSGSNNLYYLFDSTLPKLVAVRLSYLDKNSQQVTFSPQDSQTIFYLENKTLYSAKGNKALPVINNIISFKISGTNITWLSSKGTLSSSDVTGNLLEKISLADFSVDNQKSYEIVSISGNTFLEDNNALFKLNPDTKVFENFTIPVTNYKILTSPDGKNLIYWSNDKIYLYTLATEKFNEISSESQIDNCQWLNNDYIIFTAGDKIIISEIDYRGNINTIALPQELAIGAGKTLTDKSPQIFFDPQDGKLYILTQNTLLSSEKITP